MCSSDLFPSHDMGVDGDYPHSHVLVILRGKVDLKTGKDSRLFDYKDIHPNIQCVKKTEQDVIRVIQYMSKEDKSIEERMKNHGIELFQENLAEGVWKCENIQEAMKKYATSASSVVGIKTLWDCKPISYVMELELLEWQAELYNELMLPAGDRKIIWYTDRVGSKGKTTFAKYMATRGALIISGSMAIKDLATIVQGHLRHSECKICIVNLSRVEENHERIYQMIEQLKDGLITASKYQGGTMVFNSPHVVVFSNWEPVKHKLSMDRWDIRQLS